MTFWWTVAAVLTALAIRSSIAHGLVWYLKKYKGWK